MAEPLDPQAESTGDFELAEALDSFCRQMEEGLDPDPARVLDAHGNSGELAACLQGLAAIEELRVGLAPVEDEPLLPAQPLGDYQVVREIGRGGMGVVYEARHLRLGRRVALKMIKSGDLASGEERRRFLAEAQHVASLQHPNIVQIYEVGEQAGRPFLALEFIEGISLEKRLSRSPLPPIEAAHLVETLARAMHFAHQRNIVHRDLKPANVLLVSGRVVSGEWPEDATPGTHHSPLTTHQPKIADFGLAKRLDGPEGQTHTGAVLGTPPYMAPEQAAGRVREISPATDIYALGAILYETLTGRPPFKAATPVETLGQVLREEPVPPRRLQPAIPVDLQTICLKCLHKEAGRRYASAQHLADDLGRFARGEPILARPVGIAGRLWRWCRRNPLVAGLTAAASVLLLAVLGLTILRAADSAAARARDLGRRAEILRSNVYSAKGAAGEVLLQLQQLSSAVVAVAADPQLRLLLKNGEGQALQRYFEELHRSDPARGIVGPEGKSAFHSWHVVNSRGVLLADAPAQLSVVGKDFSGRDYFVGALRHARDSGLASIHVSRAYLSENDGLYKITLSAPVRSGPEPDAPVVGVVCATLPTASTLGSLRLNDERRKGVLVGLRDPNPPRGPRPADPASEHLILVHPAYELGKDAVTVPRAQLRLVPDPRPGNELMLPPPIENPDQAMHAAYEDPLGKTHPEYKGRWLAGFAPVGNTEMVVIVQQRDELEDFVGESPDRVLWTGIALSLTMVAVLLWLRWRQRRAATFTIPSSPAAESTTSLHP